MTDDKVRHAIMDRAVKGIHGIAVLMGKIDSNESLDGDELTLVKETMVAVLSEADEEILSWGIDLREGEEKPKAGRRT